MNRLTHTLALGLLSLPALSSAQLTAVTVAGANPAAIATAVNQFRTELGGSNNNIGAHAGGDGRREINWDAVPLGFSAPNTLNSNFFNQNAPRGLQLNIVGGGTGFMVSDADATTVGDTNGVGVRFKNLNDSYSAQFQTFSPERLFTPLGNNVFDVTFFVPLTGATFPGSTVAVVSGFGAVFTDVDTANTTRLQFFDIHNVSLGAMTALPASSGLSFVAAQSVNLVPLIARVRITLGNAVIGPTDNNGSIDVVALDNLIYGEPVAAAAVPEPSTTALLALGGLALAMRLARKHRAKGPASW